MIVFNFVGVGSETETNTVNQETIIIIHFCSNKVRNGDYTLVFKQRQKK